VSVLLEPQAESVIGIGTFSYLPYYGWDVEVLGRPRLQQPTLHIGIIGENVDRHIAESIETFGNDVHGPAEEMDQVSHSCQDRWKAYAMLRTFRMTHDIVPICDTSRKEQQAKPIAGLYLFTEKPGARCNLLV
jgi:hypothetical protein